MLNFHENDHSCIIKSDYVESLKADVKSAKRYNQNYDLKYQ